MTKREAAIVASYTGYLLGDFSDMQSYIEEKLGRAVWSHELASEAVMQEIHEAVRQDFVELEVKG